MTQRDPLRQSLLERAAALRKQTLRGLFAADPGRGVAFSRRCENLYVDCSRNLIDAETLALLCRWAERRGLREKIADLFGGGIVNRTESRPALHTLLRRKETTPLLVDGEDAAAQVKAERESMYRLGARLRAREIRGADGKPIERLVNIGIGGSDLGPRLLLEALADYRSGALAVDFVANMDPAELRDALARCDPRATLFVVVSKSFGTAETLRNAAAARQWLQEQHCADPSRHFIGVSENLDAMAAFGIAPEYRLRVWPWIGGRHSIWSSASFVACAELGDRHFSRLLAGAAAMDDHFRHTPFADNIPVLLGLLGVWHADMLGYPAHAVVPYAHRLRRLPDYLAQLAMESNGKSVTAAGAACESDTAAILWGGVGSNAQHSFFQLLHQGSRKTALDLIAFARAADEREQEAQDMLLANCIAQGKALLEGRSDRRQPHRHCPGDRPSVTLLFDALTPYTLGMLIALYEHKTYVEAALWDLDPFDQWGVELGKTAAADIGRRMRERDAGGGLDSSTAGLLAFYRRCLRSDSGSDEGG